MEVNIFRNQNYEMRLKKSSETPHNQLCQIRHGDAKFSADAICSCHKTSFFFYKAAPKDKLRLFVIHIQDFFFKGTQVVYFRFKYIFTYIYVCI